jgi:2-polyprenyl-6-methoxyphenol hydroxylase-like FAD-dependent oxidoreductase
MKDAVVLAETLGTSNSVADALASFDKRRKSRVKWVQQRSLALFTQIRQEPALRNVFLREQGEQTLRDCFRPLTAEPQLCVG